MTATADREVAGWAVETTVETWNPDQTREALERAGASWLSGDEMRRLVGDPAEVLRSEGNLLLTAGLSRLMALLIGAGGQALTGTSARIGVGNSATAEAVGQTDLQAAAGAGNRYFQPMDATYPLQSGGVVTVKSTFGTADGNFQWSEWGIDIGTPTVTGGTTVAAVLFNRKVVAMGTKAAGATMSLTNTITIA